MSTKCFESLSLVLTCSDYLDLALALNMLDQETVCDANAICMFCCNSYLEKEARLDLPVFDYDVAHFNVTFQPSVQNACSKNNIMSLEMLQTVCCKLNIKFKCPTLIEHLYGVLNVNISESCKASSWDCVVPWLLLLVLLLLHR